MFRTVICITFRAKFLVRLSNLCRGQSHGELVCRGEYADVRTVNWPASATKGLSYINRLGEVLRDWWENYERVVRTAMPLLAKHLYNPLSENQTGFRKGACRG